MKAPVRITVTGAAGQICYAALFRGRLTGRELWQELRVHNQLGVTRGQLEQTDTRRVFPLPAA